MADLLAGTTVKALDTPAAVAVEDATDELGFTDTVFVQGATKVGVTFTAPTTGRVLVMWTARFESNTTGLIYVSAAVRTGATIGSGTSVSAASQTSAVSSNTGAGGTDTRIAAAFFRVVTGLTPGNSYNAVTEHSVSSGNGDVFDRSLAVIPLS